MRKIKHGAYVFIISIFHFSFSFSQETKTSLDSLKKDAINIFVDCNMCDVDYFRREITFVNYVRERKEAQVHILVSYQTTASGGGAYSFFFIGQKNFAGINDTLVYNYMSDATDDEVREGQLSVLKMGLIRYVSKSPFAKHISISIDSPPSTENVKDKWRSWVFNLDAGGYFNGEQAYQSLSSWTSFSSNKITEEWKVEFRVSNSYNERHYKINDTTTITNINRSNAFDHLLVKSMNAHWSAGGFADVWNSDFDNVKLGGGIDPAIEYDLFPYSEASRKQLRFLYSAGYSYRYYIDTTIYNKTEEGLWKHSLSIAFEVKQKWGSISSSIVGSNFLHDFSLNNLYFRPGVNIRLFKGLSVRMLGSVSFIHDQISLPKAGATLEDILLQQRQLSTQYSFWGNFGITYTFGSIYNNVVNPRFDE